LGEINIVVFYKDLLDCLMMNLIIYQYQIILIYLSIKICIFIVKVLMRIKNLSLIRPKNMQNQIIQMIIYKF